MTEQLTMDFERPGPELPPEHDWAGEIKQEHRRAELERLRAGYDGCGCADCQELYRELDLAWYGDRVTRYGDFILIVAGKPGADLYEQYHKREYWSDCGQIYFTGGRGYAIAPDLQTVDVGREADILKAFDTGEIVTDLCPGPAEVLQSILDYRKEIKDNGKQPERQRPGAFRSRTHGKAKHRAAHIKPAAFRKRLPGGATKR